MKHVKTIQDIAAVWAKQKESQVKESSFALYNYLLHKHLLPYYGEMHEVKEKAVQKFVKLKLKEGLNVKSIKDMLVVLRMILRFGNSKKWTRLYEWKIKYPVDAAAKEVKVLSIAEHRKLMECLCTNTDMSKFGILLSLTTGLRIGEVCGLQWSDFNWEYSYITVKRTIERIYDNGKGDKQTKVIVNSPKTIHSARCIPVSDEVLEMARSLKGRSGKKCYLLTNTRKPLEPRTFRYHYYRLMDEFGLPRLKFHCLRHSFATRCIESECDYKTVSSLLGHANVSTTLNFYVHPDMEQKKRCLTKMLGHVMK